VPTSGVLAALAAAFCWTLASSLWRRLPTSLSAAQLNLVKNLLALALQLPLVLFGGWRVAARGRFVPRCWPAGWVGIAVGDSLYFAALRRLGTRRTLTIEAAGPAITALAGVVFLAELPTQAQWLGLTLISLAVVVVAVQQPPAAALCHRLPVPSEWVCCWP